MGRLKPLMFGVPALHAVVGGLVEFCFPSACEHCAAQASEAGDGGYPLCPTCAGQLERSAAAPACAACGKTLGQEGAGCQSCRGKGLRHIERVVRLASYDGPTRQLLLQLKFRRSWPLAEYFGRRLAQQPGVAEVLSEADGLVPIPLHRWRAWRRGFNQSDLVARAMLGAVAVERLRLSPMLRRVRSTHVQSRQTSAAARAKNVAGAFALRRGVEVEGKRLVLIDDILTTGSTTVEAARTLKRAGARSVDLIVVAVADDHRPDET